MFKDFKLAHYKFTLVPESIIQMPTFNKGNILRGAFGSSLHKDCLRKSFLSGDSMLKRKKDRMAVEEFCDKVRNKLGKTVREIRLFGFKATDKELISLARYRLSRAREAYNGALKLLKEGSLNSATNRFY